MDAASTPRRSVSATTALRELESGAMSGPGTSSVSDCRKGLEEFVRGVDKWPPRAFAAEEVGLTWL